MPSSVEMMVFIFECFVLFLVMRMLDKGVISPTAARHRSLFITVGILVHGDSLLGSWENWPARGWGGVGVPESAGIQHFILVVFSIVYGTNVNFQWFTILS